MQVKCEYATGNFLKTGGKHTFVFDDENMELITDYLNRTRKMPLLLTVDVDVPGRQAQMAQISGEQRRKIFALVKDIANFVGDDNDSMRNNLTIEFCQEKQMEMISLSDCSKEIASDYIEWLIKWAFENGVALKENPRDYLDDWERTVRIYLDKKMCIICGKPADPHHYKAIGMGRNRNTVDDSEYPMLPLCRVHHEEDHKIGRHTFARKYALGEGVVRWSF